MDRKEQERIEKLLLSVEKEESAIEVLRRDQERVRRDLFDDSDGDDAADSDGNLSGGEDILEQSDHITDTEESGESENDLDDINNANAIPNVGLQQKPFIMGKDNTTKWYVHPISKKGRTASRNIVKPSHLPGAIREGKNVQSPLQAWQLYFPDEVLEGIVANTNLWIEQNQVNYDRPRDALPTNLVELKALIGLLYLAGTLRARRLNLKDLWGKDGTGFEAFRLTMSRTRFEFLLRALRFDNINTRADRITVDKFTHIRELFEEFVSRCIRYYSVSEYVTIDEMLEGFRGRCPFRQYISNKPEKYGVKVFSLADARTFYTYNMEVYAGKQPEGPYKVDNSGKSIVERLVQPISGSGRNVTTDNWYTSIPLSETLLKYHKLTNVGTVRKNKRELPPIFVQTKNRQENSSLFAFREEHTLLSYVPKKNKNVVLLSSMHMDNSIDPESGDANKAEMLTFYNLTKGGVDVVDKMKAEYSVSRTSNRWPLTIFYMLLNISGINACIIFRDKANTSKMNRRFFLKTLSDMLRKDYMIHRLSIDCIPKDIKVRLHTILGVEEKRRLPPPAAERDTGRCFLCDRQKNRKTKTKCSSCSRFICKEHTNTTCSQCSSNNDMSVDEDSN